MWKLNKRFVTLSTAALVAVCAPAYAQNSTTYSPTTTIKGGTLPYGTSYSVEITSPSNLNKSGEAAIGSGITVGLVLQVTDNPPLGSAAEAASLVSVDASSLTFTALSQKKTVTVTISAPAGTTVGDYAYQLKVNPPSGFGWGAGGGHELSLSLSDPVAVDTTPPSVTITAPNGDPVVFCQAGQSIGVAIDAVDAESFVTAVSATVNGTPIVLSAFVPDNSVSVTGSFAPSSVGVYTIKAQATSAGGTSDPEQSRVDVPVVYATSWLPPLSLGKTSKGGSTIPIKFSARDCVGAFMADTRVQVEVWEGATNRFTAVYGEGSTSVRIDTDSEQYITNFQTATGAHDYMVKVFFNGLLHASRTFTVR